MRYLYSLWLFCASLVVLTMLVTLGAFVGHSGKSRTVLNKPKTISQTYLVDTINGRGDSFRTTKIDNIESSAFVRSYSTNHYGQDCRVIEESLQVNRESVLVVLFYCTHHTYLYTFDESGEVWDY